MKIAEPVLLSIIVTAHNCERWISPTLESVRQAVANLAAHSYEIIIINDASSDRTGQLIDKFCQITPRSFTKTTQFKNIGKVRNYAIELASGHYILMIDGDDLIIPDAVLPITDYLREKNPDIFISKLVEDRNPSNSLPFQNPLFCCLDNDQAIKYFLIHKAFQAHVIGQFIRRDILIQIPFPEFSCYEDSWVFPEILLKSQAIIYNKNGFYRYHKHNSGLSSNLDLKKILSLVAVTERMDAILPKKYSELICCHWLDVINKHSNALKKMQYLPKIAARIRNESFIKFSLNPTIRISYKRKFILTKLSFKE